MLLRLRELLADDDGESVDYFEQHRELLQAVFQATDFRDLERQIEGFEFENALNVLSRAQGDPGQPAEDQD